MARYSPRSSIPTSSIRTRILRHGNSTFPNTQGTHPSGACRRRKPDNLRSYNTPSAVFPASSSLRFDLPPFPPLNEIQETGGSPRRDPRLAGLDAENYCSLVAVTINSITPSQTSCWRGSVSAVDRAVPVPAAVAARDVLVGVPVSAAAAALTRAVGSADAALRGFLAGLVLGHFVLSFASLSCGSYSVAGLTPYLHDHSTFRGGVRSNICGLPGSISSRPTARHLPGRSASDPCRSGCP